MASKILFLVFLSINLVLSSSSSSAPIFLWSNTNAFNGHNIQEINVISVSDIVNGLENKESPVLKHFNSKSDPELIVIFVEPELSSTQVPILAQSYQSKPNGGAFSNLKRYIETSKSSVVFPYATSNAGSVGKQIISSLSSGNVYLVGENIESLSQVTKLTVSELMNNLENGWVALNNGKVDVVVINFNTPAVESLIDDSSVHQRYVSDDATLGSVMDAIEKQSSKYVAIFTSNSVSNPVSEQKTRNFEPQLKAFENNFRQNNNQLYTTYWPDGVIEALLIMGPFLGILLVGVCCTIQLQSDLKFDAERNILKKQ
jgi:hypothetical protein